MHFRFYVPCTPKIKDGIDTIGKKTTLHTVKNKVSAPYKKSTVINIFWKRIFSRD